MKNLNKVNRIEVIETKSGRRQYQLWLEKGICNFDLQDQNRTLKIFFEKEDEEFCDVCSRWYADPYSTTHYKGMQVCNACIENVYKFFKEEKEVKDMKVLFELNQFVYLGTNKNDKTSYVIIKPNKNAIKANPNKTLTVDLKYASITFINNQPVLLKQYKDDQFVKIYDSQTKQTIAISIAQAIDIFASGIKDEQQ